MANVNFRKRAIMGPLSKCLARIDEVREQWGPGEPYERRGEDQPLWFRGHADADWKLVPKLYRPEFAGADESEIRLPGYVLAENARHTSYILICGGYCDLNVLAHGFQTLTAQRIMVRPRLARINGDLYRLHWARRAKNRRKNVAA